MSKIENEMATIVTWPCNQLCMRCDHGKLLDGEQAGDSTYICELAVRFIDKDGSKYSCIGRKNDGEIASTLTLRGNRSG